MTEQEGAIDEAYAGLCRRGESGANSRAWPEAAAAGCPVARAFLVVRGGDGDRAAAEEELVRARTSGDARAALALALHGLAGGVLVASPVPNVDALLREAEREPTGAYLAASRALPNDGAPVPDKVVPLLEFAVGHMHEDALDLLERVDRDAAVRALERLLASGEHRVLEQLVRLRAAGDGKEAARLLEAYAAGDIAEGKVLLALSIMPRDAPRALALLQAAQAADDGLVCANAQRILGDVYWNGQAVEENEAVAVEWYEKAVAGGDVVAHERLAEALLTCETLPRNATRAVDLYRTAADAGNLEATFGLAVLLVNGRDGVTRDAAAAAKLLATASDAGHGEAAYVLARLHWAGDGVARDETRRMVLIERAAELGHVEASVELGMTLLGKAQVTRGGEAEHLAEKAHALLVHAAEHGHPKAIVQVAKCARLGVGTERSADRAIDLLEPLAARNYDPALVVLAEVQLDEEAVDKAVAVFGLSADLGNVGSMLRYAELGVEHCPPAFDGARAVAFLERAKEKQPDAAVLLLGKLHARGAGLPNADLPRAVELWMPLAKAGPAGIAHRELLGICQPLLETDACLAVTVLEFLSGAASESAAAAGLLLARCLLAATGVEADPERAVALLSTAGVLACAGAKLTLAECLADGRGCERDLERAASLAEQDAQVAGARQLLQRVALAIGNGDGVPADPARAIHLLQLAMVPSFAEPALHMGLFFAKLGDRAHALQWLDIADREGFPEAAPALCALRDTGVDA